jgi:hypothetical protein
MSPKQKIILFAVVWGLAVLVALAMHYFGGVNLSVALAIVAVAWVANGLFAEWEDRRPGGFLNPKKPSK